MIFARDLINIRTIICSLASQNAYGLIVSEIMTIKEKKTAYVEHGIRFLRLRRLCGKITRCLLERNNRNIVGEKAKFLIR